MARTLIGPKIRDRRKALGWTQAGFAQRIGISASYLNLIESSRRHIGGALLKRMADELQVPVDEFDGAAERGLVDDLGEIAADVSLQGSRPDPATAADFAAQHPAWARLLVAQHRALRDSEQTVAALSDRLTQDPFLGEAVHSLLSRVTAVRAACEIVAGPEALDDAQRQRFLAIIGDDSRRLAEVASALAGFFDKAHTRARSITPVEEVDDFIYAHDNHFARLEDAAQALRAVSALGRDGAEQALRDHLRGQHGVEMCLAATDPVRAPGAPHATGYDAASRRYTLPDTLPGASRRFALARLAAQLSCGDAIRQELDASGLQAAARQRAEGALGAYVAGALLMPYEAFHTAAVQARYDIDYLCRRFGASFEQVCQRLVTLRRPGAQGIRFGFMRADPAGYVTKRFPLPELPLPRHGNACPLWAVYKAFQTPGVLERQLVEFPNGARFLMLARAVEKPRLAWSVPRRFMSIMLACNVLHADPMVYADGLDLSSAAPATPVGHSCRLCVRADCAWREEAPIVDTGIAGMPAPSQRA